MTENQTRQPQGIPVGGQFAAAAHAEPDITLSPDPVVTNISIEQTIELKRYPFDELPPLPESVGTPDVDYSFEAGKVETSVVHQAEAARAAPGDR